MVARGGRCERGGASEAARGGARRGEAGRRWARRGEAARGGGNDDSLSADEFGMWLDCLGLPAECLMALCPP